MADDVQEKYGAKSGTTLAAACVLADSDGVSDAMPLDGRDRVSDAGATRTGSATSSRRSTRSRRSAGRAAAPLRRRGADLVQDPSLVKVDGRVFDEGAMRRCYAKKLNFGYVRRYHALEWRRVPNFVLKEYKPADDRDDRRAFSDVEAQTEAALWADGVGDLYTDPQLHSSDESRGDGDLGRRGMALFFASLDSRRNGLFDALGIPTSTSAPSAHRARRRQAGRLDSRASPRTKQKIHRTHRSSVVRFARLEAKTRMSCHDDAARPAWATAGSGVPTKL
ncbi:elongation factor-2 kinase [Aureococcus anophagefferens]|nr:elongation factor-2 kinase [Aureococcus anophagefferens]